MSSSFEDQFNSIETPSFKEVVISPDKNMEEELIEQFKANYKPIGASHTSSWACEDIFFDDGLYVGVIQISPRKDNERVDRLEFVSLDEQIKTRIKNQNGFKKIGASAGTHAILEVNDGYASAHIFSGPSSLLSVANCL